MPLRATAARESRAELLERLRQRSGEIEDAAMARIVSLADLPERGGPEYAQGLRAAVEAALAYGIEGMARGEHEGTPVPEALLAQARRAARSGVGLDTVLRRYVAGHALLGDFLVQEVDGRLAPAELNRLFRRLAATLDVLLAAVTAAYRLEEQRSRRTSEQRRGELVERLLAGEPLDASELGYRLDGHHLAIVACGPGVEELLSMLARALDARLLTVAQEEGQETWAWLGTREPVDPAEICGRTATVLQPQATLALGEPGEGPLGWRFSHRQARAAFPLARDDGPDRCVRYGDVALLATVLQDDLVATSLLQLYFEPLEGGRDGGEVLRETLRVYFGAERNVSSAAAVLGIDRRTVANRLRVAEQRIGSPLDRCVGEMEIALKLEHLDRRRSA